MRFHLSEEQIAIQDAVRGTLADAWPMERLHAFADGDADFDQPSWDAMMALGLGGTLARDSGMTLLDAALVCEMAGEAAAPGPLIGQLLTVAAVAHCDNPSARAHLEGLISGATVATLAFSADDPATAELLVPCARAARLFLIGSRTGGIALVEAGTAVTITRVASTDRSRPVSKVRFAGAKTVQLFPPDDPMTARLYAAALVLVAADALGGAQKVTDISVAYAKEREQFSQPIGRFQGLKHQLAHMALEVEPARALVWYAAYAWDAELSDAQRAAAIAKAHLCEVYTRATRAAIAAHGGIGYTWEYGLNYWFRRSVLDRAWLGSPAFQRSRAAKLAGW